MLIGLGDETIVLQVATSRQVMISELQIGDICKLGGVRMHLRTHSITFRQCPIGQYARWKRDGCWYLTRQNGRCVCLVALDDPSAPFGTTTYRCFFTPHPSDLVEILILESISRNVIPFPVRLNRVHTVDAVPR